MNAEVLAIGDEITSGQLLDTNSQWLSQRLQELGIRVLYHATVGDELDPSASVFRQAIDRADLVVATGGLGPTADDLTREALAAATGRELVQDGEALEHIRRLFARRKREMPKQNELQAFFPAGARVVPNPHGTAPGIDLEIPRPGRSPCRFFALPGVPAEMREMWPYIDRELRALGAGTRVIVRRNLRCFGAGESQVESMLPDLIRRGRTPTVGITASRVTITLRIAAEGSCQEECEAQIAPTAATIRECLGDLVYGEGNDELHDAVLRLLRDLGRSLASVEIGTAGLVAEWLGSTAEGSDHYRGGLVAPAGASLVQVLGLTAAQIPEGSLADRAITEAMAVACRERFGADYGLAVSGFPAPVAEGEPPRNVFFALAGPKHLDVREVPFALHPDLLTVYCAKHAVNLVRLALLREQRSIAERTSE